MVRRFNHLTGSKLPILEFSIFYLLWIYPFNPASIVFFVLIFVALSIITKPLRIKKHIFNTDFLIISILVMLIYGLIIGILNQNNFSYILRNAGGVSCFIIYFYFINLTEERSKKLLYGIFLVSFFYMIFISIYTFGKIMGVYITELEWVLGPLSGSHLEGVYRSYSPALFCCLPFIFTAVFYPGCLTIKKVLKTDRTILIRVLGIFFLVIFFLASFSKGSALLVIVTALLSLFRFILHLKIFNIMLLVLFTALLGSFTEISIYAELFYGIFNESTSGNSQRIYQHNQMLNEFSFTGNGFGATFKNILRSYDAPYGSELSFHNLIHKTGILSIPFFVLFILVFTHILRITFKSNAVSSIQLLAAFGYFLPSIGNPLLFQPALVINLCFFLSRSRNGFSQ